jgi:hypothetical protein
MKPLQLRKQLLLAESELNRAQMLADMTALRADYRALTGRAASLTAIASSVAALLAGLAAFRRRKSPPAGAKPSWLQNLIKGAGMISSLWLAFRPKEPDSEDK